MKIHASNRTIMLVESIDERSHAVVPQLNHSTVQTGEDPWSPRVEAASIKIDFASVSHSAGFLDPPVRNRRHPTSETSIASQRTPILSHGSTWSQTARHRRPRLRRTLSATLSLYRRSFPVPSGSTWVFSPPICIFLLVLRLHYAHTSLHAFVCG